MDVPWVQIGVYAQPALWLWLWDKKLRVPSWLVLVGGIISAAGVYLSGLNSGFYTNGLLIFYILSVTAVTLHYGDRPNLQPVCLGFLVVFINSFFWEFPIHVADFLEFDSFGVVAVQTLHLWPLPWMLKYGFKVPQRWWYSALVAWTAIAVAAWLHMMGVIVGAPYTATLYMCRVVGLYTILSILRYPGYGDKLIFKVKDLLRV